MTQEKGRFVCLGPRSHSGSPSLTDLTLLGIGVRSFGLTFSSCFSLSSFFSSLVLTSSSSSYFASISFVRFDLIVLVGLSCFATLLWRGFGGSYLVTFTTWANSTHSTYVFLPVRSKPIVSPLVHTNNRGLSTLYFILCLFFVYRFYLFSAYLFQRRSIGKKLTFDSILLLD